MHSEHLRNLHPGWVVGGWAVSVAVTSGAYLAAVGLGVVGTGPRATGATAAAIAVGFFCGGLFVGARWTEAPILHGAAITLLSVAVWFLGTLSLPGGALSRSTGIVLGLILLQLAAAIAGGWTGRRMVGGGEEDA